MKRKKKNGTDSSVRSVNPHILIEGLIINLRRLNHSMKKRESTSLPIIMHYATLLVTMQGKILQML